MMTSDEQAFLDAICANVADDAPRLVYADWLDQNGQSERAEFIRVQCELAKYPRIIPSDPSDRMAAAIASYVHQQMSGAWGELARRERELLDWNAHTWLFDLPPGCRPILPDAIRKTFRRGFVAEITLPCAAWLEHRDALLKATPLEQVTLTQIPWRRTHDTYTIRRGQFFFIGWEDGREVNLSFPPLSEEQRSLQRTQAEFIRNSILYGNPFAPRPQGIIHARR